MTEAEEEILRVIAFYMRRGWSWFDVVAYLCRKHERS